MAKKTTSETRTDSGPDFPFWVAMPTWTREEAIALLSGHDPDSPSNEALATDANKKIERLIDRAFESGAFPNPIRVTPEDCLSTMESCGLAIPKALAAAATSNSISIKNWRAEYERKEAELERLRQDIEKNAIAKRRVSKENDITALKRRIKSLQKVFLGISIDKFNLKREWKNTSAAKNIAGSIDRSGLSLNEDTVRTHLADAILAVGKNAKFHG